MTGHFISNHLWQSSALVLLAALLSSVLRKNSPKIRYWVWLSASLKFLIPFTLLVSLGNLVPWHVRHPLSVPGPVFPDTLVQIAGPFSPVANIVGPAHAALRWMPVAINVLWAIGFLAVTIARCRSWFRVRAALRAGAPIELPIPIPALIAPGAMEPGIVGFLRPTLVLPAQLLECLNSRQLDAILTHELCHVRRRDNFFSAVHMVVEAIFWFNPLVWWVGSRMVEERELACDEEVLRMGCEPTDYVEGILKVCRLYLESPSPCVSGVTGSDVKKRLRTILAGRIAHELNGRRKVALATIGLAALLAPIVIGMLNAPAVRAQIAPATTLKFEVASVKLQQAAGPIRGGCRGIDSKDSVGNIVGGVSVPIGRCVIPSTTMDTLIGIAYNEHFAVRGKDLPEWVHTMRFDVEAKAEDAATATHQQLLSMLQNLLADRFKLQFHLESREVDGYTLIVDKKGAKLKNSASEGREMIRESVNDQTQKAGQMTITAKNLSMSRFALYLPNVSGLSEIVDKTDLTGVFDFTLTWQRQDPAGVPNDVLSADIFPALQEQLGLRLVQQKVRVQYPIVDHVEKPTEN